MADNSHLLKTAEQGEDSPWWATPGPLLDIGSEDSGFGELMHDEPQPDTTEEVPIREAAAQTS